MIHNRSDYDHIQDPNGKIGEDEPVFLIRAKDELFQEIVMTYANIYVDRLLDSGHDVKQVEPVHKSLRNFAKHSSKWQDENGCKIPTIPDDTLKY